MPNAPKPIRKFITEKKTKKGLTIEEQNKKYIKDIKRLIDFPLTGSHVGYE